MIHSGSKGAAQLQGDGSYHIEGNHIAERDLASFVAVNEVLVDQDGTASCRQAQDEGLLRSRIKGFDALYAWTSTDYVSMQGGARRTDDIICNVSGRSLSIISNNQPPVSGKRAARIR